MATLVTLASGYGLNEGPRVDAENRLCFSDVTNGGVFRRSPDGTIETLVPKRRGVGGIALHAEGGLVISGRNVCRVHPDGSSDVLFERPDVGGFNDLFTDAQGRVLVGSLRRDPFAQTQDAAAGELWRISGPAQAEILYEDVRLTNGIGFSPDGRTLYHSDSARQAVLAHDVEGDGVANRRELARLTTGAPDGLAVDEAGCVWVAVYGGSCAARLTPEGKLDLELPVPARSVTSLCFGGADRRDLYVVSADNTEQPDAGGSIFRTRVDTPGLPAPLATV